MPGTAVQGKLSINVGSPTSWLANDFTSILVMRTYVYHIWDYMESDVLAIVCHVNISVALLMLANKISLLANPNSC